MSTTPQLPDDFVNGYWEVVAEELCDDFGMSESDAATAVAGYRDYMKGSGWAVYNDSTTESAKHAKLWFERCRANSDKPAMPVKKKPRRMDRKTSSAIKRPKMVAEGIPRPTKAEIQALPRWVRVAFAARCARRVLPIFAHLQPGAPEQDLTAVEQAVSITEHASTTAVADRMSAAGYEAGRVAGTASAAGSAPAVSASLAVEAAYAGSVDEAVSASASSADHAVRAANVSSVVLADFHALVAWSQLNYAFDSTPCPPVVAGPLWPDGVPEGWPVLPKPKHFGLTIRVPDEVDLADEQEAMRIAAGFATQFARLDIVGGGHGLVLKPPLKVSAVYAKSRVPVGAGASGGDDEPPVPAQDGRIEVTIEVADERDDPSIVTAVVQALQGGPVFHDVPDHGAPPPAKSSGKPKPLPKDVVKLTERRIEDGLRKAAEQLLPSGTEPRFDPSRWVVELQTLWNYLDQLKRGSGYEITATLIDDENPPAA